MIKIKRSVANREFIFGLMLVIIFVSLLFTWNVITSLEGEEPLKNTFEEDLYEDNSGAKVNIEILPNPETGDEST